MLSKCRQEAWPEQDFVIADRVLATPLHNKLEGRRVLDEWWSLLVYVLVLDDNVVQGEWVKNI